VNKNRLWIAVIVLVGLSAAVATAMRSRESDTSLEKPNASLPGLKKDDITSIEITNPKKGNVTLSKQDGTWSVSAPLAAKADQSAVDSLLDKLTDLEVSGVAATRKENYARLEVDAAQAIEVKVKGGDKQLADLFIGASKGGGTAVRSADQDVVALAKGSIRYAFDKELKLFRDREVLDLDCKDIGALSVSSSKGSFKFEKPAAKEGESGDPKWSQVLAKGEKPVPHFSANKVGSLCSSLAHLRAADFVAPGESAENTGLASPSSTVVLTKSDGSSVTLELGKQQTGSDEYALRLVGNDVLYRITRANADRMQPDAAAFEESAPPAAGAPPGGGLPPGMMGGGAGGQQIPPEVLRQLQQQLGQQAGAPH
jgi:hypothetical protein